jgi:hypothetical protein
MTEYHALKKEIDSLKSSLKDWFYESLAPYLY